MSYRDPRIDDYLHPLHTDQVRRLAREITAAVADPDMAASTPTKVARAVADGQLPARDLADVLDRIIVGRKSGEIASTGAYFTACVKRLFCRHGIPWRSQERSED